jgi:hypothetical protein
MGNLIAKLVFTIRLLNSLGQLKMINISHTEMKKDELSEVNLLERRRDLYERLRKQIEHEDDLINQRLNWLLLSQGFLFVAVSTLIASQKIIPNETAIICVISSFGFLISYSTFQSIVAAFRSLKRLREIWISPLPKGKTEKEREAYRERMLQESEVRLNEGFPPLMWVGSRSETALGSAATLPLFTMLTWAGLVAVTERCIDSLTFQMSNPAPAKND